jgi:hypothetical protein
LPATGDAGPRWNEAQNRTRRVQRQAVLRRIRGDCEIDEPKTPETVGEMLAAISTRIVGLLREHYGRGPSRAKSYAMDDCIVCVLRDGFTAHERTILEGG